MYCPKCGQSQVSAEVRFCSRCGFPLVGVAELLLTGGMLPGRSAGDERTGARPISPRRRGVKQGAALLLVSIFLLPFLGILHEVLGFPEEFMVLSALLAMAAVLRIIYAVFFEEGAPQATHFIPQPQHLYAPPVAPRMTAAPQESLPPAQTHGAPTYRQPQVDTGQLNHPPSVTDHTTRLLEKQSDPSER
ncbi:MAG TPA: zinc ribbon domain-containing protein [Pyrinomonadaceae bacterium]